jgi:hypothetical protein
MLLSTTSKQSDGYGRASITPTSKRTGAPSGAALRRASSIISGAGSIPRTSPLAPTAAAAMSASRPGPQPTSRTRSPRWIRASATTVR